MVWGAQLYSLLSSTGISYWGSSCYHGFFFVLFTIFLLQFSPPAPCSISKISAGEGLMEMKGVELEERRQRGDHKSKKEKEKNFDNSWTKRKKEKTVGAEPEERKW